MSQISSFCINVRGARSSSSPAVPVLRGGRRGRLDPGESRRDGEQVLDAMAHLTGEQLVALLRLLACRKIEEDANHAVVDDLGVMTLADRRDPANLVLSMMRKSI